MAVSSFSHHHCNSWNSFLSILHRYLEGALLGYRGKEVEQRIQDAVASDSQSRKEGEREEKVRPQLPDQIMVLMV